MAVDVRTLVCSFLVLSLSNLSFQVKLALYNEMGSASLLFPERSCIRLLSLIFDVFSAVIPLQGFRYGFNFFRQLLSLFLCAFVVSLHLWLPCMHVYESIIPGT